MLDEQGQAAISHRLDQVPKRLQIGFATRPTAKLHALGSGVGQQDGVRVVRNEGLQLAGNLIQQLVRVQGGGHQASRFQQAVQSRHPLLQPFPRLSLALQGFLLRLHVLN